VDNVIAFFLYRGQESAGIVTSEGNSAKAFRVHKGMGMINSVFNDDSMKKLRGRLKCG
jgi:amidophosphoribosyltransferase